VELKKSISFAVGDFNYELRSLMVSDVTMAYVEGLEREREYLKNVPLTITVFSQRKYVQEIIESIDKSLIGLFCGDVLVGTAGLQGSGATWVVNKKQISGIVTLGILIFDSRHRGSGVGKALVWGAGVLYGEQSKSRFFGALGAITNISSLKSFLACGFYRVDQNKNDWRVLVKRNDVVRPRAILKAGAFRVSPLE